MRISFSRMFNLIRASTLKDLLIIFYYHFVLNKLPNKAPHLHRLLVFAIACADNEVKLCGYSSELILLIWGERGRNLKMLVRKYTRDLIVFSEIFFEEGYLSHLRNLNAKSEGVRFVIDAGANIGCAAIFFNVYFPEATIVCIEPETDNFELLISNVEINGISSKIICIKKAIWNEITQLQLMQRDWSSDAFHVMQKSNPDETIALTDTITFSKLINDFKVSQIDLLKMDIEGAEKNFFEDHNQMMQFLPMTSYLVMEVHEEFIKGEQIYSQLVSFNFRVKLSPIGGDSSYITAEKN